MLRMKPFQSITVPEAFDWDSVPWEYFQPQKEREEAEAEGGIDEEQLAEDVGSVKILIRSTILIPCVEAGNHRRSHLLYYRGPKAL